MQRAIEHRDDQHADLAHLIEEARQLRRAFWHVQAACQAGRISGRDEVVQLCELASRLAAVNREIIGYAPYWTESVPPTAK